MEFFRPKANNQNLHKTGVELFPNFMVTFWLDIEWNLFF